MSIDLEKFTATQRNHELDQSLETGGKVKARDLKRNEAKKNKFLAEVLTIVMTDNYGKIIPGCKFKFARKKFNEKALKMAMKRCPFPDMDIDYFCDNNGTAIWMDSMLLHALPDPAYYIIVPRMKRMPQDIRSDPTYEGQTSFMVRDVPIKCKDGVTPVDLDTMKEWFLFAINEEDPGLKVYKTAITEAKEFIAAVDKKIKGVSKIQFREADGKPMPAKKAEAEREALYKIFSDERLVGEKQFANKTEALKRLTEWRKQMKIEFQLAYEDLNTETAAWFVKLSGAADAMEVENFLLKKDDWAGIKVACGLKTTPPMPPWIGRGQLPAGQDTYSGDYTDTQVNVSGTKFLRVPHGVGAIKKLDRSSANISAERFEFFYGAWECGEKMGHGIEVNDSGVYSGRFVNGLRDGHGRLDLSDGTTIEGNFGHTQQFSDVKSSDFKNPYREGHPHGQVEILFPDGAFYRGAMVNGRIQGYGEYQSGFGEVKVGNFKNGVQHGPGGMLLNCAGEKFQGTFIGGELQGEGKYSNKRGDTYVGSFDHGFRHGRGDAEYIGRGAYRGYFCNGLMTGKGELFYGKRPKKKVKKAVASVLDAPISTAADASSQSTPANSSGTTTTTSTSTGTSAVPSADKRASSTQPLGTAGAGSSAKGGPIEAILTPYQSFLQTYKRNFFGYFLADNILNGGAVMDTNAQVPKVVGRMDKLATYPIEAFVRNINKTTKRLKRNQEKYQDMDNHVRADIVRKKKHIFVQQRHYTKKTMYEEDMFGIRKDEFDGRQRVRTDRLARTNMDKVIPKKNLVPRIKLNVSDEPVTHLQELFNHIKPDPDHGNVKSVKKLLPRVILSDFEEVIERQRLVAYDILWERAEQAFVNNKRSQGDQT